MSRRKKTTRSMNTMVDIIIPVHGRFDLLEECLDAIPEAAKLDDSSVRYSIYIIDNGSPDLETSEIARITPKSFYEKTIDKSTTRVIYNANNVGFPKACNQAAKKGMSPLVFFLNSDVIMQPGSLVHLVRAMDDPMVGVAGMKLLFPPHVTNDPDRPAGKIQHVGLVSRLNTQIGHIFIGWSADHPKVNAVRDVYAVTGAALMTRRSIWNKLGGFFEGYGLGTYEDVDFCLSARKMGYNVVVEIKSVGWHYTNATAIYYKIGYPMQQNNFIFMSRWRSELTWTEWWHY